MKKFFALLILIFNFFSCEFGGINFLLSSTSVDSRAKKILTLPKNDLPSIPKNCAYSFIVISDAHFGTKKSHRRDDDFLTELKNLLKSDDETLRPRFIVNLGDTLNAGLKSEADFFCDTVQKWKISAQEILQTNDFKIFSILGNHDLYNNGWKIWKEKIFPHTSFYKFCIADCNTGFSFYFLDSANGTLGAPQFFDLEKNLKNDPFEKIVFCHYPLFAEDKFYFALNDTSERNNLISIFAQNNVQKIFVGHIHDLAQTNFKNFQEVAIPSFVFQKKFALVTLNPILKNISYQILSY